MSFPNAMKNGGPAFARAGCEWTDDQGDGSLAQDGMSLRDYFAAKAIQGFLSQSHQGPKDWAVMGHGWGEDCANDLNKKQKTVATTLANFAYQVADAMLEARNK